MERKNKNERKVVLFCNAQQFFLTFNKRNLSEGVASKMPWTCISNLFCGSAFCTHFAMFVDKKYQKSTSIPKLVGEKSVMFFCFCTVLRESNDNGAE